MTTVTSSDISSYRPNISNPNKGTERGVRTLEESIQKSGLGRSIVVDRNGVVIAGNHTLEGAAASGFSSAVEVETEGDVLVVVKRRDLDLSHDPDNRARYMVYADNVATMQGVAWDASQIIADMQAGIDLGDLFSGQELEALIETASNQLTDLDSVAFKEYDESIADEVEYCECPNCGHKFPK